jgi:uncharacterized damage-inducible protein DinB
MNATDTLTTLFRHNQWANLRLLERCAGLSKEQMEARILGSSGSLRETLEHITIAQRSYFSRISTGQPYWHPEDAPPLAIDEMIDSLRTSGDGLIEWAGKVGAGETVQLSWDGVPRETPKAIILTQVINHATEHREQVKAILTELGLEPPDLSAWTYFDELDR